MRRSRNEIDEFGNLKNGYDYVIQTWVKNYIIQDCAHPSFMMDNGPCCNQKKFAGKDIRSFDHEKF